MRVCVAVEERFEGTPDGRVWTYGPMHAAFWQRYLDVFSHVCAIARVCPVATAPEGAQRADGAGITFARVPYYVGPWQYLHRAPQVHRMIHATIQPDDAVILRVGSNVGNWVAARLHQMGKPYGVEVVQDPYDAYAPGACSHPLRPLFRLWLTRQLRQQCRRACAAAYVTQVALQQRYPARDSIFTTYYSSIDLPSHAFAAAPRMPQPGQRAFTIVMVGMLKQLYKAPDVLIDAVAQCVREGLDLRLLMVGDGQHRAELEQRALRIGLQGRVCFLGSIPAGQAVRDILDTADLFVLPSRQEGLPRALVEAMARGLPCIGSTVGGFAELLPPDDLVVPGDAAALAEKIRAVVIDPPRQAAMAARNLEHARDYQAERLRERRVQMYRHVLAATSSMRFS
jgi:glycosyltransferase involved in cell wall biosynthesis